MDCFPQFSGQSPCDSTPAMALPHALLRFFSEEDHARCSVEGKLRFGLLRRYRTEEGSRKDETEGRVSFYWNQKAPQVLLDTETRQVIGGGMSNRNIQYTGSSLHPHFILCTSHYEANWQTLTANFGRHVVRISDPVVLLERIKAAWQDNPWASASPAFIAPVVYNKGGLLEPNPSLIAPPQYVYSQKSVRFEEEREFRYVLPCSVRSRSAVTDYLTLKLPDCSDISCLA
jgi:hypothetical protein